MQLYQILNKLIKLYKLIIINISEDRYSSFNLACNWRYLSFASNEMYKKICSIHRTRLYWIYLTLLVDLQSATSAR